MSVTILVAYALVLAMILAPAAWLLERAFTGLRLPTRGVWIGALGLCIGLPLAAFLSGPRQRDPAVGAGPAQTDMTIAQAEIEEGASGESGSVSSPTLGPLGGWSARLNRALASGAALLPAGARVETWIATVWGAASVLVGIVLLASMLRLRRRANEWPDETLFGWRVKVSPATGPATIGPLRPLVVIPRWARELPPRELELVLRHEGEHVRARDTLLLAVGLVAVVACPWNPLVWWQMRRLKDAVEVDCDRRVLRSGVPSARYGELLVMLGTRGRLGSLAIPTMAGSIPLLERRLIIMKTVREAVSLPRVAAATAPALLLAGIACTTEPPPAVTEAQAVSDAPSAATEAQAVAQRREVVAIRVDRDGTVRVNNVAYPLDRVSDAVAHYDQDAVVSLGVHRAAPYRLVAALQDEVRAAGLVRVVFTTIESGAQLPLPRDASMLVDEGLPIVLPETTMPDVDQANVDPRNLLYLAVLPSGMVAVRRGGEPDSREIAPRDVEALWRENVARNPKLIALVRTYRQAEYRYMYDVLDALRRADAQRISLQLAE